MTSINSESKRKPTKKKKGPIRWEAIVPFLIIVVVTGLYFQLFFDSHLKSLMELVGYQVMGAEVDIKSVHTSFINASLRVQGVEITNPEKPTHNNLNIGDIRFSLLWDGLLRAKFVVKEAAVEDIGFDQKRKTPGKVKPPEVEKESVLKKEAEKLKDEALNKVKSEYDDNVLGNIASLLSGGSQNQELDKLKEKLVSKEKMKAFEITLKQKQSDWEKKIKNLPQAKDFQALNEQLTKVKTSGFNNPEELAHSLKEIQSILDQANKKVNEIGQAKAQLDTDIKGTNDGLKEIKTQIEKDIKDLEAHFKIPKIDAKSLATALFKKYTQPYLSKVNHYKSLFYKYAPPNLTKKDKNKEPEIEIKPHPREKGITYEFGKPHAYPLFWVQRTVISSKFSTDNSTVKDTEVNGSYGNLRGEITNITSHQSLIGKPTVVNIEGDFPAEEIKGLKVNLIIDNTQVESRITADVLVQSFPISGKELVQSDDVSISFKKAGGKLNSHILLNDYKNLSIKVINDFSNVDYEVTAKNKDVEGILKNVFSDAKEANLIAVGKGTLPDIDFDIESSLGVKLQRAFEKQISAKIEEAKARVKALVDAEINKQKELIEKQLNQFKSQAESEVKKIQDQAEGQKKVAENKINESKDEFNRRVEAEKQKVQNEAKKKLEKEGQKAVEDLKKKLGF